MPVNKPTSRQKVDSPTAPRRGLQPAHRGHRVIPGPAAQVPQMQHAVHAAHTGDTVAALRATSTRRAGMVTVENQEPAAPRASHERLTAHRATEPLRPNPQQTQHRSLPRRQAPRSRNLKHHPPAYQDVTDRSRRHAGNALTVQTGPAQVAAGDTTPSPEESLDRTTHVHP